MSVIFPGNYVTHLNAYKAQGVEALPGVEFYRVIGVYVANGTVSSGTLPLVVPSPDQRGDDKPRLDKTLTIPAGAKIYRTAVNTKNLSSTGSATVQATGISGGVTLTASSGAFPDGAASSYDPSTQLSALGSATGVTATASADLNVVDAGDTAAVIVEVCYYLDSPAPDAEDVHLGYKIEAGQGS
tara:strand:- start:252 stop:806 length:555 start_codon:yes stop_codon:yes gene_type:complete